MKLIDGFLKVCAATPIIKVAECEYNSHNIIEIIKQSEKKEVKLIVFPELCITGYTCGDLFLQDTLLKSAKKELFKIAEKTKEVDVVSVVGLPMLKNGNLYNVAAVLKNGEILGLVPKRHIPNYSEFYEARYFTQGNEEVEMVCFNEGKLTVPFGTKLVFQCSNIENFNLAIEICEDLWAPIPPSSYHALAGATIIANLSASDENTGKDIYRKELVKDQSARLVSGYIYSSAGEGESTTDLVFSAHNLISENGIILKESKRFQNEAIISEVDLKKLISERQRMNTYQVEDPVKTGYKIIKFAYSFNKEEKIKETILTRSFLKYPFVPDKKEDRDKRCEEILTIQAMGLKKRLEHISSENVVIGLSGGLDSTLALLVTIKAFDLLSIERKKITAVTMPCFGTTDRTYNNAVSLARKLKVNLREIIISEAVLLHLKDIGHDVEIHDTTYENAQARERTQILMDIANQENALVIGTGDMSELALGWATYNGDHMSMYGVNSSVPKTLVRHLVLYYARTTNDLELNKVLMDILDTPVSPELLPPEDGVISQKTEDIVGPYELHDFFLYYIMRFGFEPSKIFRMAKQAFLGEYTEKIIYKWLKIFYQRFFSQQFKRSCLPDGPKVGSVAVSPRGDLRMPSDACVDLWIKNLETIKIN